MSLRKVLYTAVFVTAIGTGLSFQDMFDSASKSEEITFDRRAPASTAEPATFMATKKQTEKLTVSQALEGLSVEDFNGPRQYQQFVAAVEKGLIPPEDVPEAVEYYQMINEHEEMEMTEIYDEYE